MSDPAVNETGQTHEQSEYETSNPEPRSKSSLRDEIVQHARNFAEGQKDRGAGGIEKIALSAKRVADGMREETPEFAHYVERAAESAEQFSHRIRERGTGDLLSEAQHFARQQPALVIGGAFVAGLLLTRFLKSSAPGASSYQPGESRYVDD